MRLKSRNPKATIVGGVGLLLTALWRAYSAFTTAAQVPQELRSVSGLLADPGFWPWLFMVGFLILLAWSLWPHDAAEPPPAPPVAGPTTHGPHSTAIGSVGGDVNITHGRSRPTGPDHLFGAVRGPIFDDITDRAFSFRFKLKNEGGEQAVIDQLEAYFFPLNEGQESPAYGGATEGFKGTSIKKGNQWEVVGISLLLPERVNLDGHASEGSSITLAPEQERTALARFQFPEDAPEYALFFMVPIITFTRADHSRHSAYMMEGVLRRFQDGESVTTHDTGWLDLMELTQHERRAGEIKPFRPTA